MFKKIFFIQILTVLIQLPAFCQTGNVGIGTNNPNQKLHVESGDTTGIAGAIKLSTPNMDILSQAVLMFGKNDSLRNRGEIRFKYLGDTSQNNQIHIGLNNVNPTVVITGDQKVGIGTSEPQAKLEITEDIMVDQVVIGRRSTSNNMVIGEMALENLTSGDFNTAIGKKALQQNTEGLENTALGHSALMNNIDGGQNTGIGLGALATNTQSSGNTAVGYTALGESTGSGNTAVGSAAMVDLLTGANNVAVGAGAMIGLGGGSNNTAIGYESGSMATGNDNIFIGHRAGYNETGDGKLYIDNTDTPTPLIYGDFVNDTVKIHGTLDVNGSLRLPDIVQDNALTKVLVAQPNGTVAYRDASTLGSGGSQWALNGNNLYNLNNGNVGIGINTPPFRFTTKFNAGTNTTVPSTGTTDSQAGFRMTAGIVGLDMGLLQNGRAYIQNRNIDNFATQYPLLLNPIGGNVSIGTHETTHRLNVGGSAYIDGPLEVRDFKFNDAAIHRFEYIDPCISSGGDFMYVDFWSCGNEFDFIDFRRGPTQKFRVTQGGNVYADGLVFCREVEVSLSAFPDYVFEDDYHLMPLRDVESYIKKHKHLPNVPSAKEVEEDGIGLGKLNKILMEKVEELTLHLIQKEKEIELMKKEIDNTKENLLERLVRLENKMDKK